MTTVLGTRNSSLVVHVMDETAIELAKTCVETVDAELDVKPEIQVFGKACHQQRNVGYYSDVSMHYNYSTTKTPAKKMHPCLIELLEYINARFGGEYNGILINKYSGGEEYIGKHSDDERGLDPAIGVIAISVGAIRKFRVRSKATGKVEVDVPTDPAHIIQMAGDFQKEFTHEIPVEKKVKGVRYSLTFRKHTE